MSYIKIEWINSLDQTERGEVTLRLPVQVGRGKQNDLILPTLAAGVSRQHARIEASARGIKVIDMRSANGTWHNGQEISRAIINQNMPVIIGAYMLNIKKQILCRKASCQQVIDHDAHMCPWCGQFTADALTREFDVVSA